MRHTLGPLLEDKLCLIFKLAPSVCRMTFPILASLLVRLVVLLPFQLLRLSLATPRSEERFSRNAETDLVCRLLLEKKKLPQTPVESGLLGHERRSATCPFSSCTGFTVLSSLFY